MNRCIKRRGVKRRRGGDDSSRNSTFLYAFPNHDDDIVVCQKFFLATLGYSNNRVVVELKNATAANDMPKPDQRGKAVPPNKKDQDPIEATYYRSILRSAITEENMHRTGCTCRTTYQLLTCIVTTVLKIRITKCRTKFIVLLLTD